MAAMLEVGRSSGGNSNNYQNPTSSTAQYHNQYRTVPRQVWNGTAWVDEGATSTPLPASVTGGGSGGGSRGSGGGSGAAQQAAQWNGYQQQVMKLLAGLQPGADTLAPRVNQAVDADLAAARAAYGNVADRSANPYANMQFSAGTFDPGTAALLQSQGMGGEAALAQQQLGQAGLGDLSNLWSDFASAMSANQLASNDAWNTDKGRDLAGVESQLGAQRSALLAAAEHQQRQREEEYKLKRMEAILSLLASGWGAGQDVSGLDLGGLI